jgi:hypothetical protein
MTKESLARGMEIGAKWVRVADIVRRPAGDHFRAVSLQLEHLAAPVPRRIALVPAAAPGLV